MDYNAHGEYDHMDTSHSEWTSGVSRERNTAPRMATKSERWTTEYGREYQVSKLVVLYRIIKTSHVSSTLRLNDLQNQVTSMKYHLEGSLNTAQRIDNLSNYKSTDYLRRRMAIPFRSRSCAWPAEKKVLLWMLTGYKFLIYRGMWTGYQFLIYHWMWTGYKFLIFRWRRIATRPSLNHGPRTSRWKVIQGIYVQYNFTLAFIWHITLPCSQAKF